jgi:uroporphyrin-III C-methyltransferase/precorrin-2 dehydrogenase/sirohydrochlorin ferrochelatase
LPLFHRIAGHPVIVLGAGEAAMAKRRLVERAGGIVYDDLAQGLDAGARLAFVAHDDPQACAGDAARARAGARWSMSSTSLPNAISPRPR